MPSWTYCAVIPPSMTSSVPVMNDGLVRREEQHPVGDVLRSADALQDGALDGLLPTVGVRPYLVAHGGVNWPGVNRVGAYPFLSVLYRRGLGEQSHRSLGRAVGTACAAADQACRGRDIDYGTPAGLPHFGNGELGSEEHSFGINVQDGVPLLSGGFQDVAAAPDGGVVYQHVQLAIGRHGGGDGLLPVPFAGDVEVHEGRVAAQLVYLRRNCHSVRVQHVGNDHLRSLPCEEP